MLAAEHGFLKHESRMQRLSVHRQTEGSVSQEVWASPQSVFLSDDAPPGLAVSIWTYVVFPSLEATIVEALQAAGADPQLTDKRTVRFSLQSLIQPKDPQCLQGLLLDPRLSPERQAEAAWAFYWDRAAQHLGRLSSMEVLSDVHYLPPGASNVAWSTRQLLHHANRGQFELCESIARAIHKVAPVELVSPIKALMTTAAERGHEFKPRADALNYKRHPLWIEFEAVHKHASRIA